MALEPDEQRVVDDIAEYGWSGTIIEEDDVGPGFEYTIGLLAQLGHPEIIIFGLPRKAGHDILWQVFREIESGRSFRENGLHEDILVGCACRMRVVDPTWHAEFFGYAMWHHRHAKVYEPFAAVQCVWPDKRGLFPDEPDCNSHVQRLQPDLSRAKLV